jgi:Integrase zinc binding domain/RNase H-like domain found in reverse transcriptase
MLAIIDFLKKWEPILTGARFDVLTDHAPLMHWKTQRELSPRQIRWNETLSQFDTDIQYIPGVTNTAADALSRYPYIQDLSSVPVECHESWVEVNETGLLTCEWDLEEENESPGLIKMASQAPANDERPARALVFTDAEVVATTIISVDAALLDSVCSSYKDDRFFGSIIRYPERYPAYTFHDGLIYLEDRLCIRASDKATRETLLATYHDDQNHFGTHKTQLSLQRDYFWPGITSDVDSYVRSCDSYARKKSST